jgi:hypothetical protein
MKAQVRRDGYLFVVDAVQIERSLLPFDLGHGFSLDRATEEEITQYLRPWAEAVLAPFEKKARPQPARQRFEGRWVPSTRGDGSRTMRFLDPKDWRYYVIRWGEPESAAWERVKAVQQVSRLVEPEMVPAFSVSYELYVTTTDGTHLPSTSEISRRLVNEPAHSALPVDIPVVTAPSLDVARELFLKRVMLEERHGAVVRALEILEEADDLRHGSPMWLLSQFVALESALTHAPHPGDPADSIGRQLRRAVPLLLRRSGELDLLAGLGITAPLDTAIKKLYELRSRIAHGEPPWPESNSLDVLVDLGTATLAIRGVLKAVLRQAIREPDLVCDLKGSDRAGS